MNWLSRIANLSIALAVWQGISGVALAAHFGLKYGMSVSDQFAGQNSNDYYGPFPGNVEATREQTLGLLLSFPLEPFRLVPTLVYLEKGGSAQYSDIDYSETYKSTSLTSHPIYVSLQGDVHLAFPVGSARFYALVSPRMDVLLAENTTGVQSTYGSDTTVYMQSFADVVWGVGLGIGQDIYIGDHAFFLEARYDRDLTAAAEVGFDGAWTGSGYEQETQSVFNRMFLFQAGVRFGAAPGRPKPNTDLRPPATPAR